MSFPFEEDLMSSAENPLAVDETAEVVYFSKCTSSSVSNFLYPRTNSRNSACKSIKRDSNLLSIVNVVDGMELVMIL